MSKENEAWDSCIKRVEKLVYNTTTKDPILKTILNDLIEIRKYMPNTPPCLIIPDPEEGYIVEWRTTTTSNKILELTYRKDCLSVTLFVNGKVEVMGSDITNSCIYNIIQTLNNFNIKPLDNFSSFNIDEYRIENVWPYNKIGSGCLEEENY